MNIWFVFNEIQKTVEIWVTQAHFYESDDLEGLCSTNCL